MLREIKREVTFFTYDYICENRFYENWGEFGSTF